VLGVLTVHGVSYESTFLLHHHHHQLLLAVTLGVLLVHGASPSNFPPPPPPPLLLLLALDVHISSSRTRMMGLGASGGREIRGLRDCGMHGHTQACTCEEIVKV
jgi:hypothetical protein